MKQIIRDASGYYLLGYNSSQAPTDGKFHKIEVEVKRKGVEVRARKGYWAYTAEDAARAEAPRAEAPAAVTAALATLVDAAARTAGAVLDRHRRAARTASRRSRSSGSRFRRCPASVDLATRASSRVMLTALAPDGRPLFRGRCPNRRAARPRPRAGAPTAGAARRSTFRPGACSCASSVQKRRGQVIDSSTSDVTVPDYTTPQVSFGTPRVFRARTPRDVQALKANAAPVPSTDRDVQPHRAAARPRRRLRAGERAAVVTARLLNRAGTSMADVPVQVAEPAAGRDRFGVRGAGGGRLPARDHAKAEAGTAQEVVAFRVR